MHYDKRQYQKRITLHLHEQTLSTHFSDVLSISPVDYRGYNFKWFTQNRDLLRIRICPNLHLFMLCIAEKCNQSHNDYEVSENPVTPPRSQSSKPTWKKKKQKTSRKILVSDSRRRKRYREKVQWCPLLVKMMCNHSLTILHRVLLSAPLNVHLKSKMSHRIFQISQTSVGLFFFFFNVSCCLWGMSILSKRCLSQWMMGAEFTS